MSIATITWSPNKHDGLRRDLTGFWINDVWDMRQSPEPRPRVNQTSVRLRFRCFSPTLNLELKHFCWKKFTLGQWTTTGRVHQIHSMIRWLNDDRPAVSSLIERPLASWELSYRTYLCEQGIYTHGVNRRIDCSHAIREHSRESYFIVTLGRLYEHLADIYDDRPEQERDLWDLRRLNVPLNPSICESTLNFAAIPQVWLRSAAKRFIAYMLPIRSSGHCQSLLQTIRAFAKYLDSLHAPMSPQNLSRPLLLCFHAYLSEGRCNKANQKNHLLRIRQFLEICARDEWLPLPKERMLHDDEIPRVTKNQPRYIEQEMLDQLNRYLGDLTPSHMRIILILQECGLRIGELLSLSFDCLIQDARGNWFLRFMQYKLRREHTIPISPETARVIQEQQQEVRDWRLVQSNLLFPSKRGAVIKQYSLSQAMRRLVRKHDIRDASGKFFLFQAHRFRHTVGTRMINLGVPQHIIQRYLGHSTPEMTSRYAHIHDETMRQKLTDFLSSRVVDVLGSVVTMRPDVDVADLQWFSRNILAQALPNGYCAIPLAAGPCPHPNACLTCTHFRTDASFLSIHKAELVETERVLQKAEANGWVRQTEVNTRKRTNLQAIIATLEAAHGR